MMSLINLPSHLQRYIFKFILDKFDFKTFKNVIDFTMVNKLTYREHKKQMERIRDTFVQVKISEIFLVYAINYDIVKHHNSLYENWMYMM